VISKLEQKEKKVGFILNTLELEWYHIEAHNKTLLQIQILGINKKSPTQPLRCYGTVAYLDDDDPLLCIPPEFILSYNLKLGDIMRFHVYNIEKIR
jgi:hypothetical protein